MQPEVGGASGARADGGNMSLINATIIKAPAQSGAARFK